MATSYAVILFENQLRSTKTKRGGIKWAVKSGNVASKGS